MEEAELHLVEAPEEAELCLVEAPEEAELPHSKVLQHECFLFCRSRSSQRSPEASSGESVSIFVAFGWAETLTNLMLPSCFDVSDAAFVVFLNL